MKRLQRILSVLIAVFVLIASLSGVFLSFDHECPHQGCTVCALVSSLEHLLATLGLWHIWRSAFSIHHAINTRDGLHRAPTPRGYDTPVALKVKLSN